MPDIFVDDSTPKEEEEKKELHHQKPSHSTNTSEIKKHGHFHSHLISSYCDHPDAVRVTGKMDDEEILLYLKRHFITNFPWIINTIGLFLIPFMLAFFNSFGFFDISFIPYNYILLSVSFYYLIVFTYAFVKYINWFYNISIVTTKRVIDIDFSSLVYENVSATKLSQLEDVSYSQIGIIRSIFDYGDVILQTAGTSTGFDFLAVPHPEKVIRTINNLIGKTNHA